MALYRSGVERRGRRDWVLSNVVLPCCQEKIATFVKRLFRRLEKHGFSNQQIATIHKAVDEVLQLASDYRSRLDDYMYVAISIGPREFMISIEAEDDFDVQNHSEFSATHHTPSRNGQALRAGTNTVTFIRTVSL